MAATLAYDIFKCNFINENTLISIKTSLNVVHKGPIENKSSLVQVMAWHQTGDKPLPETKMVHLNDTYMHHPASMSYSTTICKLVDLIPALHQSDCRIPN